MQKVRTWLTEVLLEVTNEETEDICHEVLAREKKKRSKGSIWCPQNRCLGCWPVAAIDRGNSWLGSNDCDSYKPVISSENLTGCVRHTQCSEDAFSHFLFMCQNVLSDCLAFCRHSICLAFPRIVMKHHRLVHLLNTSFFNDERELLRKHCCFNRLSGRMDLFAYLFHVLHSVESWGQGI